MTEAYQVAKHKFTVTSSAQSWERLRWHYEPFACELAEGEEPVLAVSIATGTIDKDAIAGLEAIYTDTAKNPGELTLRVYKQGDEYLFELQQPYCDVPCGWLRTSADFTRASIVLDEDNGGVAKWQAEGTITSSIMLAFMLATSCRLTLMAHAACVKHDGRAYLFIAKSGTGKSTHAQLWIKHVPGSMLLNDDHPIVRIEQGVAYAYGSPWSGKTHCYIADRAPIGAMVRIDRAPANSIDRLGPVQAYASLSSSFSGMTWQRRLADGRHQALEQLIMSTPCYTLHCRPDQEAAEVCSAEVTANHDS